jgi:hypothetical protein
MRKHLGTIGLLIFIVGIAILLRLRFFGGMMATNDNVFYGHAAYVLSQGNIQFEAWGIGTVRVGVYAPTALLYYLFGISPVITYAWPLAASILCILFVWLNY